MYSMVSPPQLLWEKFAAREGIWSQTTATATSHENGFSRQVTRFKHQVPKQPVITCTSLRSSFSRQVSSRITAQSSCSEA